MNERVAFCPRVLSTCSLYVIQKITYTIGIVTLDILHQLHHVVAKHDHFPSKLWARKDTDRHKTKRKRSRFLHISLCWPFVLVTPDWARKKGCFLPPETFCMILKLFQNLLSFGVHICNGPLWQILAMMIFVHGHNLCKVSFQYFWCLLNSWNPGTAAMIPTIQLPLSEMSGTPSEASVLVFPEFCMSRSWVWKSL